MLFHAGDAKSQGFMRKARSLATFFYKDSSVLSRPHFVAIKSQQFKCVCPDAGAKKIPERIHPVLRAMVFTPICLNSLQ